MIFSIGERITFPETELGCERAREFCAAHTGLAELCREKAHVVHLRGDFELRPIGRRPAEPSVLPTVAELLAAEWGYAGEVKESRVRERTAATSGAAGARRQVVLGSGLDGPSWMLGRQVAAGVRLGVACLMVWCGGFCGGGLVRGAVVDGARVGAVSLSGGADAMNGTNRTNGTYGLVSELGVLAGIGGGDSVVDGPAAIFSGLGQLPVPTDATFGQWVIGFVAVCSALGTILGVISFFRPQPALHKQFADREETKEMVQEIKDKIEALDDKLGLMNAGQAKGRRDIHRRVNRLENAFHFITGIMRGKGDRDADQLHAILSTRDQEEDGE